MHDVLSLYAGAPVSTRVFIRGRALLSDLEFIEHFVPSSGLIVDLGCGHGLFTNLMALCSPDRRLVGIDISAGKIEQARQTVGNRENIDFIHAAIGDAAVPRCDAITIVDVLYLLPSEEQARLLAECRRKLKEGGVLVWKTQERRPRWKFIVTYLQELLTTTIGLTHGRRKLSFLGREQSLELLAAAGFDARIVPMNTRRPYSDILFVARRKALQYTLQNPIKIGK